MTTTTVLAIIAGMTIANTLLIFFLTSKVAALTVWKEHQNN